MLCFIVPDWSIALRTIHTQQQYTISAQGSLKVTSIIDDSSLSVLGVKMGHFSITSGSFGIDFPAFFWRSPGYPPGKS